VKGKTWKLRSAARNPPAAWERIWERKLYHVPAVYLSSAILAILAKIWIDKLRKKSNPV
jgi:hypothetical protein